MPRRARGASVRRTGPNFAPGRVRAPRIEDGEQKAIVSRADRWKLPEDFFDPFTFAELCRVFQRTEFYVGDFLFHPPNGGHRSAAEAAIFKAMGVRPGVADLVFDLPSGRYHGARFEVKGPRPYDAKVTAGQQRWIDAWAALGYWACVVRGFEEWEDQCQQYLDAVHGNA